LYPTISDLLKDIFGVDIPLPIQSFGFFVAISFLLAAWTLALELKRKEREGLLTFTTKKVLRGAPASASQLIFSALLGFIVGYKLFYFILNYSELVDDPQGALLSAKGNLVGGIIGAIISAYLKFKEKAKDRREAPEWVEEKIYPHQLVGNITIVAAVTGLLGAKLFHNLEYIEDFIRNPVDALLSFSGLTMYGGLIVGAAGVIWYGKKNGIPALHMCDANSAGLMLAYGVGRMGCQIAGDGDWGIVNTAPKPSALGFLPDWFWAYRYPHNVINEGVLIQGCTGTHCFILAQPVFPTPLYESIICIGLFFVLWSVRKKFLKPGTFFSLFLLLNGIERFFIELIRVNAKYHINGFEFTQAQLISVSLVIAGIAGLIYFRNRKIAASIFLKD
jgi:phosphatidylglycerol---prolipoprotein diacylglyceryl transferase